MRKLLIFLFTAQFLLISCNNPQKPAKNYVVTTAKPITKPQNLPQVVATTSIICDLTKQIAANTINLICLIPRDTDIQTYKPTPENSQVVRSAKLILYNGYNLETDLISLIKTSQTPALKIAVGESAVVKPLFSQQGQKKTVNPYLWHDVQNSIKMTTVITNNLKKIAPQNTNLYTKNHQKIKIELNQLDTWIKSRIQSLPPNQRTLITNHYRLIYYTKAYKLKYETLLVNKSKQDQLSADELSRLVNNIQETKISTIFLTNQINPQLIDSIVSKSQIKSSESQLITDNLTLEPESSTYQKMMETNTRTIVEGLGGTYLIFQPSQKN